MNSTHFLFFILFCIILTVCKAGSESSCSDNFGGGVLSTEEQDEKLISSATTTTTTSTLEEMDEEEETNTLIKIPFPTKGILGRLFRRFRHLIPKACSTKMTCAHGTKVFNIPSQFYAKVLRYRFMKIIRTIKSTFEGHGKVEPFLNDLAEGVSKYNAYCNDNNKQSNAQKLSKFIKYLKQQGKHELASELERLRRVKQYVRHHRYWWKRKVVYTDIATPLFKDVFDTFNNLSLDKCQPLIQALYTNNGKCNYHRIYCHIYKLEKSKYSSLRKQLIDYSRKMKLSLVEWSPRVRRTYSSRYSRKIRSMGGALRRR